MYFFPLVVFRELKEKGYDPSVLVKAYELYSEEMIKLHFGQGFDIWWHTGKGNPNVDEYLQMCAYKTL
jgi:geranylgeranyl pyrophosphate synthase